VRNALASLAVALELELSFADAARALAQFAGVDRRFEVKGEAGGVTVVDDYGHHPTEIDATLRAAREVFGDRRLLVGFQPHRYSRTRDLAGEFQGAFHGADVVLLADIYPAGEPPIAGVSAEALAEGITAHGHREACFVGTLERLVEELAERSGPGDVVLVLGAGDVARVAEELLAVLHEGSRRRSGGKG
jgi:UDP-N-acetylmuramate--alanine ligase